MPPERLAALRKAFQAMVGDPAFVALMKKRELELGPAPGTEIDAIVQEVTKTPKPVLASINAIVQSAKKQAPGKARQFSTARTLGGRSERLATARFSPLAGLFRNGVEVDPSQSRRRRIVSEQPSGCDPESFGQPTGRRT